MFVSRLLVLVVAVGCGSLSAANSIQVKPGGPVPDILQALELARDGDTILVDSGRYEGSLTIDKSIRILGSGSPEIFGDYTGDVLVVAADDVEVSGFRVSGSGNDMLHSNAGIQVLGARARILNNEVTDNLFGIYLRGCEDALIEGNRIRGRAEVELGRRGAGVHFYDALRNTVRRNDISEVRDGVYFDHSDLNVVEDNEFSHLRYGVHYMYCKENRFLRNTFRDSVAGVAVMYTEKVVFKGNRILNNREGYNAFGLLLKDSIDSVAEENVILNNVHGVFLDSSHRNQFRRNLIAYNDVAVVLFASSLENAFSENDFIGNQAILHTVGKADADWSPNGFGNYYSDYAGYDLDADGVGDVPHRLQDAFEYLLGSRPRLRLFLNSSAADALALAEASFPLVPSSDERDRAPRMKPVGGARLTPGTLNQNTGSSSLVGISGTVMLLGGGWLCARLRR